MTSLEGADCCRRYSCRPSASELITTCLQVKAMTLASDPADDGDGDRVRYKPLVPTIESEFFMDILVPRLSDIFT